MNLDFSCEDLVALDMCIVTRIQRMEMFADTTNEKIKEYSKKEIEKLQLLQDKLKTRS